MLTRARRGVSLSLLRRVRAVAMMGDEWPTLGQARARGTHVRFDDAGVPSSMDTDHDRDARYRRELQHAPSHSRFPHDGRQRRQPQGPPSRHVPSPRDGWQQQRHASGGRRGAPHPHGGGRGRGPRPPPRLRHATPEDAAWHGVDARRWHPAPRGDVDELARRQPFAPSPGEYRVMSYNVLADSHARAHPELYRGKDDALLTWPRRLRGILAEVRRLSPDVLCLQECEDFEGVARGLAADGYVGIHAPRSGDKPDGSSLFYRSYKCALESSETIDFQRVGLKNNAAAVACLRPVADAGRAPPPLVVGCIHVLFNPKRGDYKLGQVRTLIERVEAHRAVAARRLAEERRSAAAFAAPKGEPQVILAGDFNAEPDSPLYHFVAAGELDVSRVDRRDMSGCLVEGEGGVSSEWHLMMETGGFDRDEEEWDELEAARRETRRGRGSRGRGHRMSEEEKIAERLREYFWDEEALTAALGSVEGGATPWRGRFHLEHCYRGRLSSCYRGAAGGNPRDELA